ncbi:MAG TPA: hypothetical protein DCQ06_01610 [Myxococcales bacterium]|nr:hypothetical protein [Myxococcales bacterium]HAN30270.1 hypothetical protein [Myxococcales bacterium]
MDYDAGTAHKIFGVDFSGAQQAGRTLALAEGVLVHDRLTIERVSLGRDLPNSGLARKRCYDALGQLIAEQQPAVVGIDAPLALPATMMRELSPSSTDWVTASAAIAAMTDPYALRQWCRARSAKPELKRVTDRHAQTPMSPYNLRVVAQTWGAARLLEPMLRSGQCVVWPCQPIENGAVVFVESCPASLLLRVGQRVAYKRREHTAARKDIVAQLLAAKWGLPFIDLADSSAIIEDQGGDLLDSVMCAWLAARQLQSGWSTNKCHPASQLEAWVIF